MTSSWFFSMAALQTTRITESDCCCCCCYRYLCCCVWLQCALKFHEGEIKIHNDSHTHTHNVNERTHDMCDYQSSKATAIEWDNAVAHTDEKTQTEKEKHGESEVNWRSVLFFFFIIIFCTNFFSNYFHLLFGCGMCACTVHSFAPSQNKYDRQSQRMSLVCLMIFCVTHNRLTVVICSVRVVSECNESMRACAPSHCDSGSVSVHGKSRYFDLNVMEFACIFGLNWLSLARCVSESYGRFNGFFFVVGWSELSLLARFHPVICSFSRFSLLCFICHWRNNKRTHSGRIGLYTLAEQTMIEREKFVCVCVVIWKCFSIRWYEYMIRSRWYRNAINKTWFWL